MYEFRDAGNSDVNFLCTGDSNAGKKIYKYLPSSLKCARRSLSYSLHTSQPLTLNIYVYTRKCGDPSYELMFCKRTMSGT